MQDMILVHHGVKGMKWGVRRYQNKDGSLTAAGKKQQQKRERRANELDAIAKKYRESYVSEFKKAADTLERDGIHGKSKYMRRLNETDWNDVYDGSKQHRQALKDVASELRKASDSAAKYSEIYSKGAKYLRSNPEVMGMSYRSAMKNLRGQLAEARKKHGYDLAEGWDYVIDDDWDYNIW